MSQSAATHSNAGSERNHSVQTPCDNLRCCPASAYGYTGAGDGRKALYSYAFATNSRYRILPLAPCVSILPLQKIPPSDNIIFFAEMDGGVELGGATFGFFRSFDLRLKSGL